MALVQRLKVLAEGDFDGSGQLAEAISCLHDLVDATIGSDDTSAALRSNFDVLPPHQSIDPSFLEASAARMGRGAREREMARERARGGERRVPMLDARMLICAMALTFSSAVIFFKRRSEYS